MCWVLVDLCIDENAKYGRKIQIKREYVNRSGKIIKQGKFILIVGVNCFCVDFIDDNLHRRQKAYCSRNMALFICFCFFVPRNTWY